MKVKAISIPNHSLIKQQASTIDFQDCFTASFEIHKELPLDETVYQCFNSFEQSWVDSLFRLRNQLVKPFGLIAPSDTRNTKPQQKEIKTGGKVAFFDVIERNNEEVLMYINDSHLAAYFSILLSQNGRFKTLYTSTTVEYHNKLGKFYFAIIKPFHKLIMKTMIKNLIQNLNKN